MTTRRCRACGGLGKITTFPKAENGQVKAIEQQCRICNGIGKIEKEEGARTYSLGKRIGGTLSLDQDVVKTIKNDESLTVEAFQLWGLIWTVAIIFGIVVPDLAFSYIELGSTNSSILSILVWVVQLIIYHISGSIVFFGTCTLFGQVFSGHQTKFIEIIRVEAYSYAVNIFRIGYFLPITLLILLGAFIGWIISPIIVWTMLILYVWWFLAPIYPLKVTLETSTLKATITVIVALFVWSIFAVLYSAIIGKEIILLPLEPQIGLHIVERILEAGLKVVNSLL